ncbi:serine protease [Ahniella affigens]|uniref:Serine protease n=1 Tax=Ahniella affigens TaxID=2021234 RepID=A0A2P1PQN8_9GAMM|nr:S8 family serine peptidase [Ahniella affigens]AVP97167.1 serine protease [Ahniella affigens]
MSILKVFVDQADAATVLAESRLIEAYEAFLLVETTDEQASALAARFPVEDISDQFEVQVNEIKIPMKGLAKTPTGASMKASAWASVAIDAQPHHYIVQFIGPIKPAWLTKAKATGAQLREARGNFSYIVCANAKQIAQLSELPVVRWIGHLRHADRVCGTLFSAPAESSTDRPRRAALPGMLRVQLFASKDLPAVVRAAKALGFKVLGKDAQAGIVTVSTQAGSLAARRKQVTALSAVHGVKFIRPHIMPRTFNNIATGLMGGGFAAQSPAGMQLTGAGEIVAVCDTGLDTGDPVTIHPDFAGRIKAIRSYPISDDYAEYLMNPGADDGASDLDSGHGTHVAGSVLGSGVGAAGSPDLAQGFAPKAKLVFQAIEQEMKWKPQFVGQPGTDRFTLSGIPNNLRPLFQWAYQQGARIHSNSWGGGVPGAYDAQSEQFDRFSWDRKDLLFVIAAGNDGVDSDRDGTINLGSVSSPATCKNGLTVGASENLRPEFNAMRYGAWWPKDFPVPPIQTDPIANDPGQVAAFSSRGPTLDQRIKPDVVAPGTFILSVRSSMIAKNHFAWAAYPPNKQRYMYMGGTSMATPLVAGALALIRQYLRTFAKIAKPSAALMKALVIAGAEPIGGTAESSQPDNHQGYGRVNLERSLKQPLALVEGPSLSTGKKATFALDVPEAGKTLRLVLSYTDVPGPSLINDLNLIVSDPHGKKYVGNQRSDAVGLSLDNRNNTELVAVRAASQGRWQIDVVASNVSSGRQPFALVAVLI